MALLQHSGDGAVRTPQQGHQRIQQGSRPEGAGRDQRELPAPKDNGKDALAQAQANRDLVKQAVKLADAGELDDAWTYCDRALKEDPDEITALICATQIHYKAVDLTTAYQFARRACGIAPDNAYCWGNLGNIEHELYRFEEAEFCFRNGLQAAKNDAQKGFIYLTYAAMLVQKGDWGRALPMCRKAFAYKDKAKTRGNLGLSLLAVGQWKEAWPLYDAIIGFDKSRRKMQYAGEQEWDGAKGKSIVVYDEQGIGDAMSFASMVPDALKDAKVVIDIRPELAGLFKRSFPEATVYGSATGLGEDWRAKHQIDASISLGGLGKLYRPTPESCPGTPYLVPDPERMTMWRALFGSLGKPVIGIAWSGGMEHTGAKHRQWTLEQLLPIFKSVDAVWVSLQYKDASKEIEAFRAKHPEIDLRQYAFGTLTKDYDDTAALVASVDLVVAMQTAVIHLAGAIGKECWCFVNKHGQWRYGPNTQTSLPWYYSVRLFRNIDGWPLEEAANELRSRY